MGVCVMESCSFLGTPLPLCEKVPLVASPTTVLVVPSTQPFLHAKLPKRLAVLIRTLHRRFSRSQRCSQFQFANSWVRWQHKGLRFNCGAAQEPDSTRASFSQPDWPCLHQGSTSAIQLPPLPLLRAPNTSSYQIRRKDSGVWDSPVSFREICHLALLLFLVDMTSVLLP